MLTHRSYYVALSNSRQGEHFITMQLIQFRNRSAKFLYLLVACLSGKSSFIKVKRLIKKIITLALCDCDFKKYFNSAHCHN